MADASDNIIPVDSKRIIPLLVPEREPTFSSDFLEELTPTSSTRRKSKASLDLEDLPQSIYDYSLFEKIQNDDFESILPLVTMIDLDEPTDLRGIDRALILAIGSRKFKMSEFIVKNGGDISCKNSIILEKEIQKIKIQREAIPFLNSEQIKISLKIITRCKEVISYLKRKKIFVTEEIKILALDIPEIVDLLK